MFSGLETKLSVSDECFNVKTIFIFIITIHYKKSKSIVFIIAEYITAQIEQKYIIFRYSCLHASLPL